MPTPRDGAAFGVDGARPRPPLPAPAGTSKKRALASVGVAVAAAALVAAALAASTSVTSPADAAWLRRREQAATGLPTAAPSSSSSTTGSGPAGSTGLPTAAPSMMTSASSFAPSASPANNASGGNGGNGGSFAPTSAPAVSSNASCSVDSDCTVVQDPCTCECVPCSASSGSGSGSGSSAAPTGAPGAPMGSGAPTGAPNSAGSGSGSGSGSGMGTSNPTSAPTFLQSTALGSTASGAGSSAGSGSNSSNGGGGSFSCLANRPTCASPQSCPNTCSPPSTVAICDRSSQTCSAVPAWDLACGGFVMNAHKCPPPYVCVHPPAQNPDGPGHCLPLKCNATSDCTVLESCSNGVCVPQIPPNVNLSSLAPCGAGGGNASCPDPASQTCVRNPVGTCDFGGVDCSGVCVPNNLPIPSLPPVSLTVPPAVSPLADTVSHVTLPPTPDSLCATTLCRDINARCAVCPGPVADVSLPVCLPQGDECPSWPALPSLPSLPGLPGLPNLPSIPNIDVNLG